MIVKAKNQDLEFAKSLPLVVSIDLSCNNFTGEFSNQITKLQGLVFLNLSRNHINGLILQDISMLHELQSLDLSCNNLCGTIPSSMLSLTFFSYLDLSNYWERLPNTIVLKMTFPFLYAKNRFNKQLIQQQSQPSNNKSTTMRQHFLHGKPSNEKGKNHRPIGHLNFYYFNNENNGLHQVLL